MSLKASIASLGNLLLLPDGRPGLIDFGQVKRLDDSGKLLLAQIVETLAEGDEDNIYTSMLEAGMNVASKGRETDKERLVTIAYVLFDTRYMEAANVRPC